MKYLDKLFSVLIAFVAYIASTWLLFDIFNTSDVMKLLGVVISLLVAISVYKIVNKFIGTKK